MNFPVAVIHAVMMCFPRRGKWLVPITSGSRQAWLLEQTVWLLIGGVGSREAKPQAEAASADTGHTQNQRPGLPQSHYVEVTSLRQPKWGAESPTVSSTDKM